MEGVPGIFVDQSWVGSVLQQQRDQRRLVLGTGKHQCPMAIATNLKNYKKKQCYHFVIHLSCLYHSLPEWTLHLMTVVHLH